MQREINSSIPAFKNDALLPQQMSENYCQSLTNPLLVGKGRKISNPQLAKVGKHRETTESPEAS
jgi:hypothetical protein